MARRLQKNGVLKIAGVGACAAVLIGGGLGLASAGEKSAPGTRAAAQVVSCPDVRTQLPAIPAAAQAGVDRELALLDQQISEANARLADLAVNPQGGANFVQNAILGPLRSKRVATLDRIAINVNRASGQRPAGLESLATCGVGAAGNTNAGGTGNANPGNNGNSGNNGNGNNAGAAGAQTVNCPDVAGRLPAVPAAAQAQVDRELAALRQQISEADTRLAQLAVNPQGGANFVQNAILGPLRDKRAAVLDRIELSFTRLGAAAPAGLDALATCGLNGAGAAPVNNGGNNNAGGNNNGNNNGGNNGGNNGAPAATGARTVNCPDVASRLPAVPAAARAGVDQELANLRQQITEANNRLAQLAANPQGGANFIQNAILGPLEDRRVAVINRIATNIGRVTGERPVPPLELAPCGLN
jgi:hypothetical protein